MAYFPMFVDITGQPCLVVGGGEVALRKVRVLREFDARVSVVAPRMCSPLQELALDDEMIELIRRGFLPDDCHNMKLVVAATDSEETNHQIATVCRQKGIPVNAVDQKEDCTFIFPSYIKEKNIVAAVSSGGNSPLVTQKIRDEISETLTPLLGEINEILGEYRQEVQNRIPEIDDRKEVYLEILKESLERGKPVDRETIRERIRKMAQKSV